MTDISEQRPATTGDGGNNTATAAPARARRGSLNTMLLSELQQLAGGMGIATAKLKKSDLIAAIRQAQSGAPAAPPPRPATSRRPLLPAAHAEARHRPSTTTTPDTGADANGGAPRQPLPSNDSSAPQRTDSAGARTVPTVPTAPTVPTVPTAARPSDQRRPRRPDRTVPIRPTVSMSEVSRTSRTVSRTASRTVSPIASPIASRIAASRTPSTNATSVSTTSRTVSRIAATVARTTTTSRAAAAAGAVATATAAAATASAPAPRRAAAAPTSNRRCPTTTC